MKMKTQRYISSLLAAVLCALVLFAAPKIAFADRNAPPDETAVGDRVSQMEAELQRMKAEEAARKQREADAARRAAEAKRRAAEQRARAERERRAREAREAEQRRFSEELTRGATFILNGRYRDGLTVLRAFAKAHPYSADAWYWIALAHHELGDYDRAQYAVNIALEIDPYYPQLTKTPSGLQPMPKLTKQTRKEPRPTVSVLPTKPLLPTELALSPVTISFPLLRHGSPEEKPEGTPRSYDGRDPVTGAYLEYLPYPPNEPGRTVRWQQDEKFTEISRWRFRVDRMGILKDPQVPIAWRGSYPYEVYFWTGTEWARARRQRVYYDHKESFDDTLARAQESIRDLLDQRGYRWDPADTPALAASASHFRYMWMGEIDVEPAHIRDEELARRHFIYDTWDEIPREEIRGGDGNGSGSSGGRSQGSSPSNGTGGGGDYY